MTFNANQPAYRRLRDAHAERLRPLVFWVGAGLSQPARLPGWGQLRDALVASALETAALLPEADAKVKEAAIDEAASSASLWEAFQILKREMGRAEFREEIRRIFDRAQDADVPPAYRSIWELPGVRGMLTLNLDEFAAKSHKRTRLNEDPAVFMGRDAADYAHVLSAGRPFIGNLHGVMDANQSWVFTRDEISALVNLPGYKDFISLVFGQMTVVFCGISAEDGAAGGFLEALSNAGLDLGPHYWITDRVDTVTHTWAADAGISVIRYSPLTDSAGHPDHVTPLQELFSDLREYISKDRVLSPLIADVTAVEKLPSPKELRVYEDDDVRSLLSGHAKSLLTADRHGANAEYERFLKEYAQAIHRAWYVTSDEPYNQFYSYTVERRISSSPFASVWRVRDPSGDAYALKVLRLENLRSGPEIDSFRRGVQSLTFLTAAAVPGTASLKEAFEIPTAVVMQYIEGASLHDVIQPRNFDPWIDGLPVLESVCAHLKYGHRLPQGVLHRDVRPSNVIVPYFYWQPELGSDQPKKHDVALLNYDMSWHSAAKGESITGNLSEAGYYAPEQVVAGDQARSTLVDSYGVGMCIYFTFTKKNPPTAGSRSTDWTTLLDDGFKPNPRLNWRSAPVRLRRLIERATAGDASVRPTVDQIESELGLLRQAITQTPATLLLPADFWAEELICRSESALYETNSSGTVFSREPRPGRRISLEGNLRKNKVVLNFKNQALGSTNRSGADRIWSEKLQRARDILQSSGWQLREETQYGNMELLLSAEVDVRDLAPNFERLSDGLARGIDQVRID